MSDGKSALRKASGVGGVAIPMLTWALSMLGATIPGWLGWPALGLSILMLAYSAMGIVKHAWKTARNRGYKTGTLAVFSIAALASLVAIVLIPIYFGAISSDDFFEQSTELSGLSNSQLRVRAIEAAKQLRKKKKERVELPNGWIFDRSGTDEERSERFLRKVLESQALDKVYVDDFNENYRPELMLLRKELRIRLQKLRKYGSDRQYYSSITRMDVSKMALDDSNLLMGGDNILIIADMIENMGKDLP